MDPELLKQLQALQLELKGYRDKAAEETKQNGTLLETTKTALEMLQKQVDAIDVKLAERHTADEPEEPLVETFQKNEAISRIMKDRRGRAVIELNGKASRKLFERKTTFLSSGAGSLPVSGVLQIDRLPGVTLEARQQLTIRDLLPSRPTAMQVIDYVKVNAALTIASPQTEGSSKAENTVTFTSASERVKTISTFLRASRQILEDFGELMGFLQSSLPYYTDLDEEIQLLSGDGTGENLNGLITQATSFNTGLLSNSKGWNKIDEIARSIQQIQAAKEVDPTFVVMHPNDWWDIRLTKDSYGRYILGDPQIATPPMLWNKTVVPTTNIAAGTFLVGNGNPAAIEIRDRMQTTVDISTEDADNFTKNLVTIRCEKRVAQIVRRPHSFITGTFTTSPA